MFEFSWGLTYQPKHPSYQQENLKAMRALNRAALLFADTDADMYIACYNRGRKADDLKAALEKMAEACDTKLPFGFSDLSVFGPQGQVEIEPQG